MYLIYNLLALVGSYGVMPAVVIFGLAGRWDLWNVWAYAGIVTILLFLQTMSIYRTSPDLLKERIRPPTRGRVRWPSSMVTVAVSFLQFVIAGLDERFHWPDRVPLAGIVIGLAIVTIGVGLMNWSVQVNRFFSPVTRLQADRGQRVISTGPYRLVRHPGYAGALLWVMANALALNSLLSMIPAVILMLPLTVNQTVIEDAMLRDELAGYAEYAARVRYRLIPGMW